MNPRPLLIACAIASLTGAAMAQYKVVAPDGSVTYTDRPPLIETSKVTPLRRGAGAASAPAGNEVSLPFDLRQTASRYPVTLYSGSNCQPCDNARQLLLQRGVPYTERSVTTEEDTAALSRLTGGRTLPSLTVGQQPLRGFNPNDWGSYIDAAGYPRESRLPAGWRPPTAVPLVARESAPAGAAAAPAPSTQPQSVAPPPPSVEAPASEPGIRF